MSQILGSLDVGRRSRLAFQFEAADRKLLARTAQVGSYARNDTQLANILDSVGRYGPVLPNQPKLVAVDTDGDGIRDAVAYLVEAAGTNLAERSEALATSPWTATTLSASNAFATYAGLSFCRVSSANSGSLKQSIGTLAGGNGVYTLSVRVHQDAAVTGTFSISIEETGGTVRGRATVTIATGGVVTVVAATGSAMVELLGDGAYLVTLTSTTCTAANAHTIFASNFVGGGGTATSYLITGIQLEFGPVATSYLQTAASTQSRAADVLTFPFVLPPQATTWYVKFIERGTVLASSSPGLVGIGASTNAAFFLGNSGGFYTAEHLRSGAVNSTQAAAPAFGQLVELRALLNADGSVQLGQSIAGGSETLAAASASNAFATAWHDTTLTLGDRGGVPGYTAILSVRIALGAQTLSQMRATA